MTQLPKDIKLKNTTETGLYIVTDYLVEKLRACFDDSIKEITQGKTKNLETEGWLSEIFCRYIVGERGGEQPDFLKVDEASKEVHYFNGKSFTKIDKHVFECAIRDTMQALGIGKVYCSNSHKKIVEEAQLGLASHNRCAIVRNPRFLAFRNGVLDLDDNILYPHHIDFGTTMMLDFDYQPNATFDRWDEFLDEVIPSPDFRMALQDFCGTIFVDRNKYKIEKACWLLGGGSNGKSVFMTTISNLIGKDHLSAFSPETIFKSNSALYNIASLNGKILNICDDASDCDISGGEYKSFVSGAAQQARNPYGMPFKVERIPLLMVGANKMPITKDDTHGYHRRNLIIDFNCVIEEDKIDVTLTDKLSSPEAKSAIMNWILEGRRRMVGRNGKFANYGEVNALQKKARDESNNVLRWLRDKHYIAGSLETHSFTKDKMAFFNEYVEYCDKLREKSRSKQGWERLLADEGFCNHRRVGYCISIDTDAEDVEEVSEMEKNIEALPF